MTERRENLKMNQRQRGLTLIELIVVVAIIAILAAIAYPSYQDYVRKSRRAAAKGDLLELAQFMERNYTEANRYDQDSGGNTIDTAALPFNVSPRNGTTYYNLSLPTVSAASYALSAAPTGSQSSDDCGTLGIDNTGARTASVSSVVCW